MWLSHLEMNKMTSVNKNTFCRFIRRKNKNKTKNLPLKFLPSHQKLGRNQVVVLPLEQLQCLLQLLQFQPTCLRMSDSGAAGNGRMHQRQRSMFTTVETGDTDPRMTVESKRQLL